jgi:hypothetical protein
MTAQVKGFGCRPIAAVGAHAEGPASVRAFAAFIGRSPDTATAEDLRRFQHHQAQTGVRPPSINSAVAALRFFFTVTLDRPDLARRLTIVREPRRLPAVPRARVGATPSPRISCLSSARSGSSGPSRPSLGHQLLSARDVGKVRRFPRWSWGRCLACTSRAAERQRAGEARGQQAQRERRVRLRVPAGVGRMNLLHLNVAADGTAEMLEEEAESFLRAGWERVDAGDLAGTRGSGSQ